MLAEQMYDSLQTCGNGSDFVGPKFGIAGEVVAHAAANPGGNIVVDIDDASVAFGGFCSGASYNMIAERLAVPVGWLLRQSVLFLARLEIKGYVSGRSCNRA